MRSRYCAFKLKLSKYITLTTHQDNPDFTTDVTKWLQDINSFSQTCEFQKLQILEFSDGKNEAYVTFHATLSSNGEDCSFTEKSKFYKVDNKWLYHSGEFL